MRTSEHLWRQLVGSFKKRTDWFVGEGGAPSKAATRQEGMDPSVPKEVPFFSARNKDREGEGLSAEMHDGEFVWPYYSLGGGAGGVVCM